MATKRIEELEQQVKMNPEDEDNWYELGMAYDEEQEWVKAYEALRTAETAVLNRIGERFKSNGDTESASIYFRRAQKVEAKMLTLAPEGTHWLQNFLIITGVIALITFLMVLILWPTTGALIILIVLLLDFLVFLLLLPIAIAKHITQRKRNPEEFLMKLRFIESQIIAFTNNQTLPEMAKFIQVEKLKQRRARVAQELMRRKYFESMVSQK